MRRQPRPAPRVPDAYLELHIEQGPVLAAAEAPLGVVTAIVGYARGELVFEGSPGHAGTTPMEGRSDALIEAASLPPRTRHGDSRRRRDGRADRGRARRCERRPRTGAISIDARAPDASGSTSSSPRSASSPRAARSPSLSGGARAAFHAEIVARDLPVVELASGAGHDAGMFAAAGVDGGCSSCAASTAV